jgi:hypothetical protein
MGFAIAAGTGRDWATGIGMVPGVSRDKEGLLALLIDE